MDDVSLDRIHQQYHKENVVDFNFDVVEESKEFQKLSLTDDMPPQPQVPKKKVDDSGKQLEQKPVAAHGDFCCTDFSKLRTPWNYSPCLDYSNSLTKPVVILDKTPVNYPYPCTYSPLNPPWFKVLEEKLKDSPYFTS